MSQPSLQSRTEKLTTEDGQTASPSLKKLLRIKTPKAGKERVSTRQQCPFCESCFNKETRLQAHLQSFHGERAQAEMVQCKICNVFLPNQDALSSHLEMKHAGQDLAYLFDPMHAGNHVNSGAGQLQESEEDTESSKLVFGSAMETSPSQTQPLTENENVLAKTVEVNTFLHSAGPKIDAGKPQSLLKSTSEIKTTTTQNVLCQVCIKSKQNSSKYINHVNASHQELAQERWIKCSDCQFYCPDEVSLTKHSQKHKPESFRVDKVDCSFCEKTYVRRSDLLVHVNKVHKEMAEQSEWLNCKHCSFLLPTQNALNRHVGTHKKSLSSRAAGGSNKEDVNSYLEVSMAEVQAEMNTEPEDLQNVNESSISVPGACPTVEGERNYHFDAEDTSLDVNINSIAAEIRENNMMESEDTEEISLLDSDAEDIVQSTPAAKKNVMIQCTQMIPNLTPILPQNPNRFVKTKSEYTHNGIYASTDCFETEDAIIMKIDYMKERSKIYFPENGPYRCEMCYSILQTNRLFFDHIRSEHLMDADEEIIGQMEEHLKTMI